MRALCLTLAALALNLPGCASTDHSEWFEHPTHAPLRPYHVVVDESELAHACRQDRRLLGCAVRVAVDNVCIIYTPPRPAAWVLEHERRHCAGYDHA